MSQLMENVKVTKLADPTTAGTSTITSSSWDMQEYEGFVLLTAFGTAAANNTVKIQDSSDNSTFADVANSSTVNGTTDKNFAIEVYKPKNRYHQAVFARGTSTTIDNVWLIRFGGKVKSETNLVSGSLFTNSLISP